MNGKARASLGFDDPLEGFDPQEWSVERAMPARVRMPGDAAEQAARAAGFKSREAKDAGEIAARQIEGEPRPQRRRRTGRNAQLNLKAKPETIAAYCALADRMGWGLGETLERAVVLLEREYGSPT